MPGKIPGVGTGSHDLGDEKGAPREAVRQGSVAELARVSSGPRRSGEKDSRRSCERRYQDNGTAFSANAATPRRTFRQNAPGCHKFSLIVHDKALDPEVAAHITRVGIAVFER